LIWLDDAIAAPASAPGGGLRGVIRLSGAGCIEALAKIFEPDNRATWADASRPWRHTGRLQVASVQLAIPVAVLVWPTRRSYTGEQAAEVHLIGSAPLLEAVLSVLYEQGVRPARAGEFTLRAFLAGRVDLLQAEAVLGVIDATDDAQLRAALAQLAGGLSGRIARLHERLLLDLADLEAGLDFVEEDIEFIDRAKFACRLENAQVELQRLLSQAEDRMESRPRLRVVLAGLPNAGKSTLFNALAGSERALVSALPGTTRDYLSARVTWDGHDVELVDTAGSSEGDGELMRSAHALREVVLKEADVILWCAAGDATESVRAECMRRQTEIAPGTVVLRVGTKTELGAAAGEVDVPVSARTGEGLTVLQRRVLESLQTAARKGEFIGSSSARCRESLRQALGSIEAAHHLAARGAGDELIAAELRTALEHTGQIAGRVYTDDILDRIFSRFCIGK
jgi:tRNA modification GTPase